MFYIKENDTGYIHRCEDCDLYECLRSWYVCADYNVKEAIDALCDNTLSPETRWAEAYLNITIYQCD